jgi:hypothetical protein
LASREGWKRPEAADDDQAFLMVQFMETWLLADRDRMRQFFGPELRESSLPAWPSLEAVSKDAILKALAAATAACGKRYVKGRRSAEVSLEWLANVDPAKVERACPHARSLLDRLRAV